MARLELDGLSHRRPDGTAVVDGVSLDVADGELVALLGTARSGKSTLLRMLIGLADITGGELRIDGERANDWAPAERDLAMVFQDYAPYPHLTVRDNIAFPLRLAGVPGDEVDRRVAEVARLLELTVHLDRWPSQLSGGQRQRVAIGRVIVRRPSAFLLDEPLSTADPGPRERLQTALARVQRESGTSTVYATHEQREAMTLGDRVGVLRRGRLEQVGRPHEVYERPATLFVAALVDSWPLNVLPAAVAGDVLRLPVGDVPLDRATAARLAGRDTVVAAIRPEHVEDAALVDTDRAGHGVSFTLPVAGTEWTGSEQLVHLRHRGPAPAVGTVAQLPARPPEGVLVARLDRAGGGVGQRVLTAWVEARRILLFDAETGAALPPADPPADLG